jgi:mycoredoxin
VEVGKMQIEQVVVYRRSWCEDSDAAVAYFDRQGITYQEIDIERDAAAARGVEFVTGGHLATPTLLYGRQAVVFDPWNQDRFDAWWRFANTDYPDAP